LETSLSFLNLKTPYGTSSHLTLYAPHFFNIMSKTPFAHSTLSSSNSPRFEIPPILIISISTLFLSLFLIITLSPSNITPSPTPSIITLIVPSSLFITFSHPLPSGLSSSWPLIHLDVSFLTYPSFITSIQQLLIVFSIVSTFCSSFITLY